ncbi:signal peptide peptidase SppA [Ilyomonas limi]|uniref:Signal peptide peptidase SppA n=1 Tax=Ilyomonas limi TaxID=2575867 RepID=A0A4U3KU10_9BACT|nr:signal peptide peptidase SppA [Ilyomonas limi]TKK65239.1 signal peptide peptidase SppA [Ilyomonas limi]
MKSFFKIFFASLLAIIVFCLLAVFIIAWIVGSAMQPSKPNLGSKGVLVLDLSTSLNEQGQDNPINSFADKASYTPGLYDVVRMLHYAKYDSTIKGLYIKADDNSNGLAASEELLRAVQDFKGSKKFVIAYGETMSERAYYIASAADKVYCHPAGGMEWDGYAVTLAFVKNLLDKLEIQPEIFYAGKFKSATEPFRATEMTDPNRLQTSVWLGDLYNQLLQQISTTRGIDTAQLHQLASSGAIQTANDALKYRLVDGLKYDNDIKTELLQRLHQGNKEKVNFINLSTYAEAVDYKSTSGSKIAVVFAEGDIVDGKAQRGTIASDQYRDLLRKLRLDDDVKAIVLRVNSPGGSALASDVIANEVTLARKAKPVVVSMGDYAASGGYYISCSADSIFANASTITGSIGVFTMIPNLQSFFKNKLGITFDGVKTAEHADMMTVTRPLTQVERQFLQNNVDTTYNTFKQRVAAGRNKSMAYIDSIAQGRVWTGARGIPVGIVDRIGTLQDAIAAAAKMAKTSSYYTRDYPEPKGWLEQLLENVSNPSIKEDKIEEQLGKKSYQLLLQLKNVQSMMGTPQAKLPFNPDIK